MTSSRMKIKLMFSILMIGGLLGCTKKTEHQVSAVPQQFPSSSKDYKRVDNLPYLSWWQQFNDQELNLLIDLGLKNNNDIHIAIGNLQEAQVLYSKLN